MNYIRALAEESPFPFEEEFFHSQCKSAWDANPPMVSASGYQSVIMYFVHFWLSAFRLYSVNVCVSQCNRHLVHCIICAVLK